MIRGAAGFPPALNAVPARWVPVASVWRDSRSGSYGLVLITGYRLVETESVGQLAGALCTALGPARRIDGRWVPPGAVSS